jgi:hypothetical protein
MIGLTGPLKKRIKELEQALALSALRECQLLAAVAMSDARISSAETSRRLRVNTLKDIKDAVQTHIMASLSLVEGPGLTDYRKTLEAIEAVVSRKIALERGIVSEPANQETTRKMVALINEQLSDDSSHSVCEGCGE